MLLNLKKKMNNERARKNLKEFLEKAEAQQNNGPFPTRDSDIIEELSQKLEDNAVNYDNEPVTACPNCNSLYLIDNEKKIECFNCGHEVLEKDVVVYKSIIDYLDEDSKD